MGSESATPSVSILLLVKNEYHNLIHNLDLIARQHYGGAVEIVCIDSGSTDGTLELLQQRGIPVHSIPPADFHHGRTRNYAASLANNEILVLLSGDARPVDDQWLAKLAAPFADPAVGAVYGKQIAPEGTGAVRTRGLEYLYPDTREERVLPPGETGSLRLVRFSNANSAVRTSVWRQYQFHERVLVAEDHWVCYNVLKAGMTVVYEPEAAVVHGHERSVWGEFQFAVDNAISLKRMGIFDDPQIGGEFRYGLDRIISDWKYFTGRRQYGKAVGSFIVSAVKWVGVQLGKREATLPTWFVRRISRGYDRLYK